MSARSKLERVLPETSGFNRRRIAVAAAVVVATLAAVTFILTRGGSQRGLPEVEPAIPTTRAPEPRELLEEEPADAAPPPIFEPDFSRVFEEPPPAPPPLSLPPIAAQISDRVERAFSQPVRPMGPGRSGPPARGEDRSGKRSMFEELEAQAEALSGLLEHSPSLAAAQAAGLSGPGAGEAPREPSRPRRPSHAEARREAPRSRWVLAQGTVIPAQLVTEINSDLPGQVLAQVMSDVHNSGSFREILVPRGTKLTGRYDSDLRTGQNRLAVEWSRLLLPDGSSIDVETLPAVDGRGRSGLRDRVRHHTGRVFGNALLLSLLSAGFEAAQPSGNSVRLSAGELAVEGASQELERAASELLRRNASIPPTVRIRAGTAFGVMLLADLSFPTPYAH